MCSSSQKTKTRALFQGHWAYFITYLNHKPHYSSPNPQFRDKVLGVVSRRGRICPFACLQCTFEMKAASKLRLVTGREVSTCSRYLISPASLKQWKELPYRSVICKCGLPVDHFTVLVRFEVWFPDNNDRTLA